MEAVPGPMPASGRRVYEDIDAFSGGQVSPVYLTPAPIAAQDLGADIGKLLIGTFGALLMIGGIAIVASDQPINVRASVL